MKSQEEGTDRMKEIASYVREGAMAYLKRQYSVVAKVFVILVVLLTILAYFGIQNPFVPVAFLTGGFFSGLCGYLGMKTATYASNRTAWAASKSLNKGLQVALRSGAVMGLVVVGFGLLDIALWFIILDKWVFTPEHMQNGMDFLGLTFVHAGTTEHAKLIEITAVMLTFGMGASTQALFARVGGGIFTKAAYVGADLVGKVEAGIPEDDPRNPATIADNVGDNVGDVAGMGADLFDSNVASLAAALVMAVALGGVDSKNVMIVFCFAAIGLLASIIGVGTAKMGKKGNPTHALNMSTYITTAIFIVLTFLATLIFKFEWRIWVASVVGLLVGVVIGITTDYFTNDERKPVRNVAKASESGPAFTIINGVSYGFLSVLPAMIGIAISALAAYKLCEPLGPNYGMFGISMAAVGMLSIVGMIISNDAYGPIVDNARGLVEMGNLGETALEITDSLDSAGNTVKAVTKGFSIGAAGLTVIALLGAFMSEVNTKAGEEIIKGFDVMDPVVFFGLLVGAAVPAVFSALLMLGVNRNAERMVKEIHRQFQEIPGLIEGKEGVQPEYDKCIAIATTGALRELIPAGLFAIVITILVGFIGGVKAVGGFLVGNIVSGLLLALFMSNSGGLWDNGKKYVESGNCGGKGSPAHKAAVVGDTVGDPFKDTAGPSINTQITVVSLLASLLSTIFLALSIF